MATKLYPPQLEGTLPAFYKTYSNSKTYADGANIIVPFGTNRVVSANDVFGMYARIRTIATNTYLVTKEVKAIDWTSMTANIELTAEEANKLNEGLYYKLLLAFIDASNEEGYSSTVGIIKCIAKPSVAIAGFDSLLTNQYSNYVTGIYELNTIYGDSTEKVYSYEFTLWDDKDNVIASSGVKIHDSTLDISSYASEDYFKTLKRIKEGTVGFLQYTVTTMNGLVISSPRYLVMKTRSVDIEYPIDMYAQNNYEDGYITLTFKGYNLPDSTGVIHQTIYSGTFVITRGSELDEYDEWEEITRFVIDAGYPSDYSFRDYTVLQGVNYRYALLQYNQKGLYSNEIYSINIRSDGTLVDEATYADFEDMFLYDGVRLLKVRYNPKVDSFKNTIPELKIETIGSKYPFIFRNGQVCYKEFPIAGLLSFEMDDAVLFLLGDEVRQSGIMENDYVRNIGEHYMNTNNYSLNNSNKLTGVESYYKQVIKEEYILDPITGAKIKDKNGGYLTKTTYTYVKKYTLGKEDYATYLSAVNELIAHANDAVYKNSEAYTKNIKLANEFANRLIIAYNLEENEYSNTNGYIVFTDATKNKLALLTEEDLPITITNDRSYIAGSTDTGKVLDNQIVRLNKDLTSQNMMSERYFKLKVLDWLTDGRVKLFRSPSEGNYLVRLLNVSMKPIDPLGRMIHEFTCTGYEIAELTYDNLVYYNIIDNSAPNILETHWSTFDINPLIDPAEPDKWILIPLDGAQVESVLLTGFAPGDLIHLSFVDDISANDIYFTIGLSGNFNYSYDDRIIGSIEILPIDAPYNDFDRNIVFAYPGTLTTNFDTIKSINTHTQIAEEFVGPKDNLLESFDLLQIAKDYEAGNITENLGKQLIKDSIYNKTNINYCLGTNNKFTNLNIEILYIRKRTLIPIYACEGLIDNNGSFEIGATTKFCVTPFGIGYVNSQIITEDGATGPLRVKIVNVGENEILEDGFNAYDIATLNNSDELKFYYYNLLGLTTTVAPDGFLIFEVYLPQKDNNNNWVWVKSNQDSRQYYDTFTKDWWNGNELYNPTFFINTTNKMPFIEKANGYYADISGLQEYWHKDTSLHSPTLEEDNENTNVISVNEIEEITLYDLGKVECISLGNGVIADITCQLLVVDYLIEEDDALLAEVKAAYKKTNTDGSIEGAIAEAANQINNYMSLYTKKLEAIELIRQKQEEYQKEVEEIEKDEEAIKQIAVIREGLYRRLLDYLKELYYDIQGESLRPSVENRVKYRLPLMLVFNYLINNNYATNMPFWDNTNGFRYPPNENTYYFYDKRLGAINKYTNDVLVKHFSIGRSVTDIFDSPEDFPLFLNEVDEEGKYTNTVATMKSLVLKIAKDNTEAQVTIDNSQETTNVDNIDNGDLYEIIVLFSAILDMAKSLFDRSTSVDNLINNNPALYEYVLVGSNFFIPADGSSPVYDINKYTYYNKAENGAYIKHSYATSLDLERDVLAGLVYINYITYRKYEAYLIENILNLLYDTSKSTEDEQPDTNRIYDLLHYYDTLKSLVLTEKPLTLEEYKKIFFIGNSREDYQWMFIDNPFASSTGNDETIATTEEVKFEPIYAQEPENGEPIYFLGIIVDTYDNLAKAYYDLALLYKEKEKIDNLLIEYDEPYIEEKDISVFIQIPEDSVYSKNTIYYLYDEATNKYNLWTYNNRDSISNTIWSNNKSNLYTLNNELINYYYKNDENYIHINKNDIGQYINDEGLLIQFNENLSIYRDSLYYEKTQEWDALNAAQAEADAQIAIWLNVIDANTIINDTSVEYDDEDKENIAKLIAYAHERIAYYESVKESYKDQIATNQAEYSIYMNLRELQRVISQKASAAQNVFNSLYNQYNGYVNTYISLIYFDTTSDEDTNKDPSFLELLDKYLTLINTSSYNHNPTSPIIETSSQNTTTLNNDYLIYKGYLNDMLYGITGNKVMDLISLFNLTADTWEAQKEFVKKYDYLNILNPGDILIRLNKLALIMEEIKKLQEIANIEINDDFDPDSLMDNIKDALVNYLFTLGVVYLDKVERRYG